MSKEEQLLLKKNAFLEKELAAKNREQEIEASLEKVRARTMTMQKASEFVEVINVIGEQFINLGFDFDWVNFSANGIDVSNGIDIWNFVVIPGKYKGADRVFIPYFDHPVFTVAYKKFKEYQATGNDFYALQLDKETKDQFAEHLFTNTVYKDLPDEFKKLHYNDNGYITSSVFLKDTWLSVGSYKGKAFPDEQNTILKRLGNTFGQAYTRFLDLEKAEAQAREAEIELSLQRVRAAAMGMKQPSDMLEVCKIISEQLTFLDVKEIRNVQTAIIYEASHSYMNYEYYGKHDKTFITEVDFLQTAVQSAFADQMLKGKGSFFSTRLEGDKLKDFIEQQKKGPEFVDPLLFTSGSLSWYWHSLGPVALGISTYAPLNENEVELFKRFRNVFELAYRRYLDIEKAEAQARQAEIELALERVRARTMAMQHSSELSETTALLFRQMNELGNTPERLNIGIIKEDTGLIETWATEQGGHQINHSFNARLDEPTTIAKLYEGWKAKRTSMVVDLSGNELKQWIHYLQDELKMPVKEELLQNRRVQSVAYFKEGFILITTPEPLPAETISLLERFAEVFNLTYTRFLDLQNAEAQARESQIEAALERVRSRSLAMHRSDELKEAGELLWNELDKLGIQSLSSGYVLMDPKEKIGWFYAPNPATGKIADPLGADHTKTKEMRAVLSAWERQEPMSIIEMNESETIAHQTFIAENGIQTDGTISRWITAKELIALSPKRLFLHNFNFKEGYLMIVGGSRLTDQQVELMLRFTKVFQQTYTRFNDLQNAEAQARESQIQLALERVRARTMAMYKSEELPETSQVLFRQLLELGDMPDRLAICIVDEAAGIVNFWLTDQIGTGISNNFKGRLSESTVIAKQYKAWKEEAKSTVINLHGKELNEWIQFVREEMGIFVKDDFIKNSRIHTTAFFSHGWIMVTTNNRQTADTITILEKFASVFNLTYRRFLDLQKAETQARESQIQLALERVRARTMAMYKSEELPQTAQVLFHQLLELGDMPDRLSICIIDETLGVVNFWLTDQTGTKINTSFKGRLSEPMVIAKLYKAWKEQAVSMVIDLRGKELNTWIQFVREEMGMVVEGDFIKKRRVQTSAFFSDGWIMVAKHEPETAETISILERFASVFNLTYRRFLDLQKAEAQAREAEIEAALERVRSRSMGMQKSENLKEIIQVVYEQFVHLHIPVEHAGFIMDYKVNDDMNIWLADQHLAPFQARIPYFDSAHWNSFIEAKEKGNNFFVNYLGFDEKNKFYEELFKLFPVAEEAKEYYFNCPGLAVSTVLLDNIGLYIENFSGTPYSDEENKTLMRFGKVFEQTYTRFLDLQKAEAQARESQIQLALERVRARTMAMQKSEELAEVANLLFQQAQALDLPLLSSGYNIWEKDDKVCTAWMSDQSGLINPSFKLPLTESPMTIHFYHSHESGESFYEEEVSGEPLAAHYRYLLTLPFFRKIVDGFLKAGFSLPTYQVNNVANFLQGNLIFITYKPVPEAHDIFKRFAKVFEQTYTRFLDLQKAEAQARESQIQLALERVRARTMAMQKSKDLIDVITVLSEQFQHLGFTIHSANFNTNYRQKDWDLWLYNPGTPVYPEQIHIPYLDNAYFNRTLESIAKGEDFTTFVFTKKEKDEFLDHIYANTIAKNVPEERKKFSYDAPGFAWSSVYLKNTALTIANYDAQPYTEEQNSIIRRFGGAFEQSFTRFLDLQKAEAQAREAQIELGLERVRARAMAMQKSNELKELIGTVFTELTKLDLVLTRCVIMIYDTKTLGITWWMANSEDPSNPAGLFVKYHQLPPHLAYIKAWKERELKWQYVLKGKIKKEWDDFLFVETELSYLPDFVIAGMKAPDKVYLNASFNSFGNLTLATLEPLSNEHFDILLRFAKVFDLTYTRFNDLQKAEAQAREAKIEAALERVRARTMAMYKSENLNTVAEVVFTELGKLELGILRCGIGIINKEKRSADAWITSVTDEGKTVQVSGTESMDLHPLLQGVYNAWLTNSDFSYILEGEDLVQYYKTSGTGKVRLPDSQLILSADEITTQYYHIAVFEAGGLFAFSANDFPEEAKMVMKRFAAVFNQSYTRFLDLQKAEAQTREAKIEASLERVRGKAMAMHSSRDLADTIDVFYHEMELLSITPRRCGVGLMDKETHMVELSTMNTTEQGESVEVIGNLKLTGHPVLEGIYDNWILQKEYRPVLRGNEIKKYYQLIRPQIAYPDYPTDTAQYGYFFFFNEGGVYAWTEKELSEDELKIYRRFTSVLSLTYKRYKDLKDAEANGREAIKRASLDRVRAETASMRTTGDLEKITPLIWNELTTLNVPFIRCGVFIMDEEQELIHSFLSTPEGKAIAAFQLPYQSAGELSKVLIHWHKNEMFKDHWNETTFAEWTKSLVEQGAIGSEETYSTAHRPVNLHLHFLPFLQGMLYVGSEAPLNDEQINLVQNLADAFSTAYARYEDFNKLESAKEQIEKTLVDLKQAQAQLVQSEKMASLGELTAGIAHEIQNPLNFVNNFSDVNTELIDELNAERLKPAAERDEQLENEILNDIKENEEKINHHGKRADAIVKGMLQHSRKTSGQKEPTDINALADEYLRLSYHGLRAKDKTFNAELKTDFDGTIGKINLIPQDIGRVLLNLFNNAFYAVSERQKAEGGKLNAERDYQPSVFVTTMKCDDKVQIIVRDNGNGIPQNIVDKIFQPFFTTKPTGQGTGLGLSLAYDIIKVHGGSLKVESKEGEGSEFMIQLPAM